VPKLALDVPVYRRCGTSQCPQAEPNQDSIRFASNERSLLRVKEQLRLQYAIPLPGRIGPGLRNNIRYIIFVPICFLLPLALATVTAVHFLL